ncbi:MAG: 23S rRNA (adenine(2503)-C(2))-methyltransferase RlmN, partial [Actinomycetota bacterium]|nr:23S rRNA (adenine(2503)-C(2))-methyltransferase RlmN [Actinomycetota bacterium]
MDPYSLGPDGLATLLASLSPPTDPEPAYRAAQVWAWLSRGVEDPAAMTDLPAALRGRLADAFDEPPRIVRRSVSDGGLTHKVLMAFPDGEATESVLMLYGARGGKRPRAGRATVCVSTQAGCAMGCPFCATGQAGFRRQLGAGEIVRQVTVVQGLLRSGEVAVAGAPDHVTNIVFMGMGEPLANLEATLAALRWLCGRRPDGGFGLSARALTVSTVGLTPGIRRLASLGLPITLAVSLHAPNDALRDDLVPVNRQHPLGELLDACRDWVAATGRRLSFEYVLISGVNDALEHAEQLAGLITGLRAHINLIPMNPTPAVPWRAPPRGHQRAFAAVLERSGLAVSIRRNRGNDIDAACGQLYADHAPASGRILPAAHGAAARVEAARAERAGGG